MTIPLLMTKSAKQTLIHSSELALLVLHSTSRPPTLMQKENAKTRSTLMLLELEQFADTMQWMAVIFQMVMYHSSNALILTEMQLPRNAKQTRLLQLGLEKVFVVTLELTREFSVETIWYALITFVVQNCLVVTTVILRQH
jgi:hypothetical protein